MTRQTDEKARVALFSDFANQMVVVERISEDEVRIRKAPIVPRRKHTLKELLARTTSSPELAHPSSDEGSSQGGEAL